MKHARPPTPPTKRLLISRNCIAMSSTKLRSQPIRGVVCAFTILGVRDYNQMLHFSRTVPFTAEVLPSLTVTSEPTWRRVHQHSVLQMLPHDFIIPRERRYTWLLLVRRPVASRFPTSFRLVQLVRCSLEFCSGQRPALHLFTHQT